MYESSHLQEEYVKYLNQTIEMRKEILELSKSIIAYKESNQDSKHEILSLQQILSDLENELSPIANNSQMTGSICGDTTVLSSVSHSISLKKYPTKDSEPENFGNYFINEIKEEAYPKHFEHFCIIGAVSDKVELNKSLSPEILYVYPEFKSEKVPDTRVLKNLAFPTGLFAKSFKDDESINSQIYEVLYHSHYRDGNSFVFTIQPYVLEEGFKIPEMVNNDKSTLYCCCVIFDDLVLNTYFGIQFIVPRCYCFLTFFPCFELHFEVLYRLLALRRTKIFELASNLTGPIEVSPDIDQIFKDEGLGLIEMYYEYNCENVTSQYLDVSIFLQSVESIEYCFPDNFYYIDKTWLCPLLFSLLNLKDFYCILCAVLIEKNVIFVGKIHDGLSSCVLGFQSLIMPLKTHMLVRPIISDNELNLLTPDKKFIVGYPGVLPVHIEQRLKGSIIVKIDDFNQKSKIYCNEDDRKLINQKDLTYLISDKIKDNYQKFHERLVYIANDSQIEAQKKIIDEVKKFVMWVTIEIENCVSADGRLDVEVAQNSIKYTVSKCNQEFLCAVACTQTFISYFNEKV